MILYLSKIFQHSVDADLTVIVLAFFVKTVGYLIVSFYSVDVSALMIMGDIAGVG